MKTKVLVTGANGQLAKTIHKLCIQNDKEIDFTFVSKNDLDITEVEDIIKHLVHHNYDYCINCAAYTNVEEAEKNSEKAFKVNAESVKNLAKVCKESNTVLIHISTDYVFDGEKGEPYSTNDMPNPINEYGKSKLKGEIYIQDILEKYFIVRTSWLYSKEFGHNFYRTIIEKTKTEKKLFVTNNEKGCPTNTINLSNFLIDLIKTKSKKYGIKHFCDAVEMTWFDFAEKILKENKLLKKITLVGAKKYLTFARRPRNSVLINTKD